MEEEVAQQCANVDWVCALVPEAFTTRVASGLTALTTG
jgi:hypothetical protein